MSLTIAAVLQAVALAGRLQHGVVVVPDTVRVGDPFTVSVRVRAPQGAVIEFPAAPDSGAAVEPLDPVRVRTTADSIAVDQTAEYRLAAWRVGFIPIEFADVVVRQDIGTRRVPVTGVFVVVASVLPADTAAQVPKPPRAPFLFGTPWWVWAVVAAAALGLLMLLAWLWRRSRRRPPVRVPPITVAERAFERVESLGLVAAGEPARHVDLMVEVLRDYLAAAIPAAPTSLTSTELAATLRRARLAQHARCATFLSEADLVKFAGHAVAGERAAMLGREARTLVTAVDASLSGTNEAKAA